MSQVWLGLLLSILVAALAWILKSLLSIDKNIIKISKVLYDSDGKRTFYTKPEVDKRFNVKAEQLKGHRANIMELDLNQKEIKKKQKTIEKDIVKIKNEIGELYESS